MAIFFLSLFTVLKKIIYAEPVFTWMELVLSFPPSVWIWSTFSFRFFLITFVVYERLAFYAYNLLHAKRKQVENLPHYREKTDRLLFRLVNHLQPRNMLEV